MSEETEPQGDDPVGPGLDRSRVDDSVYQPFQPGPMVWGIDKDGLPSPKLEGALPHAPPLLPENFVCIADTREFVIRDRWGDVVGRFGPEMVQRSGGGAYFVTLEEAIARGVPWVEVARRLDWRRRRVRVEPLRPQCRFLAQQMTDFQDETDHVMLERLCTARRDDERFFVGLRDTELYACELREPRDFLTEARIERFNDTKIKLGRERKESAGEGAFDVDKALDEAETTAREGLTANSIFSDRR